MSESILVQGRAHGVLQAGRLASLMAGTPINKYPEKGIDLWKKEIQKGSAWRSPEDERAWNHFREGKLRRARDPGRSATQMVRVKLALEEIILGAQIWGQRASR